MNNSPSEEVREKCNKALAYYEKLLGETGQDYFRGDMDVLFIVLPHVSNHNTEYTHTEYTNMKTMWYPFL